MAGGALNSFAQDEALSEQDIIGFMIQVASGVKYLHNPDSTSQRFGVFHGDLKGENIFLTIDPQSQNFIAKVGDLENQVTLPGLKTYSAGIEAKVGTYTHMLPEMLKNVRRKPEGSRTEIGRASDIWSAGCVALEVFGRGHLRYLAKDGQTVIASEDLIVDDVNKEKLDDVLPDLNLMVRAQFDFQGLIKTCLTKDPKQRPKIDALHGDLVRLSS